MKTIGRFLVFLIFLMSACTMPEQNTPTQTPPAVPPTSTQLPATATSVPPTPTTAPTATSTPIPGTVALDFVAQLCNAQWMNGGQHLKVCPAPNSNHSGGYAVVIDPKSESLPASTPVILTTPAVNGFAALFLRYPAITVQKGDRFRAMLRCQSYAACDVDYALEYYDANNQYHSPFLTWKYKVGDPVISVDADMSTLAGQSVTFVLALRPNNNVLQQDNALWIAPQIYRPAP
jgi:hypothetical protein